MRWKAAFGLAVAVVSVAWIEAQGPAGTTEPRPRDAFLGVTTYRLWEGEAPGASGTGEADVPTITQFRVHTGTGNGTAVIVAPGGAYLGLASNLEGRQVADWFAARGVTAFVLRYRLGKKYLFPTPLLDAQRAIRLVRARAKELGIASDRIGMMGFSAGGHLTASAGTMFDAGKPDAADGIDRVSSRPDFIVLGYPWLNAMKPDPKRLSYCRVMDLPPDRCGEFERFSPEQLVTADAPPAFIYHTTDDELVPVDASLGFYRGLMASGVPVEMHLFAKGRHGSGLGLGDASLDLWPTLLEAWMRGRGLLTPDPAVTAETRRLLGPPKARAGGAPFGVDQSIPELTANPAARAVLAKHLGADYVQRLAAEGRNLTLQSMVLHDPEHVSAAALAAIEAELRTVPR